MKLFPLVVGALCLCCYACFQPQSGCLDINAANFDASVDKNCCCVYPRITVNVNQVFGNRDSIYLDGRVYPYANGVFRLNKVVFYLSELSLFQNSQEFRPTDVLALNTFGTKPGDTLTRSFINDFMLVRRTDSGVKNAGTFRQTGIFDQVKFRIGLSDSAQLIIPFKAPASHPLHTQSDSMWLSKAEGFVFARIIVARDTVTGTIPDTLVLTRNDFLSTAAPVVSINTALTHKPGYDLNFNLWIDYKALLQDVDWSVHDPNGWKLKIRDNFLNAFTISQ